MTGLAGDFAPTSESQWRKLVDDALKGAAFEKLVSRSDDGFAIQPIYTRRVGPRALRANGPWRVMARVDHPDAARANRQALEDLANGADGLEIIFAGAAGAYGYGLADADAASLDALFDGVVLDAGPRFELDLGPRAEQQARAVAAFVERSALGALGVDLSFGLDPLGAMARSGVAGGNWSAMAESLVRTASDLKQRGFAGPFLAADARCVHAAGGSPAQELAFALAAAVDYFRALANGGFAEEDARAAIAFRLAADADEFISLVKFRALRLLWARVGEVCEAPSRPIRIHGESAWRMMTARDPWMNVLRGAMAAFCAGLGGADSVSVLPFTQALGLPDPFARRLARNAQLLLLEESHLGFVADPAAGAGAFEALTQALCEAAWSLFQTIEAQGGLYGALAQGQFQALVGEAAETRMRDIARRKAPLIGVSDYPDLAEIKVETLAVGRPTFSWEDGVLRVAPLAPRRLAEPFEALRDVADDALARDGSRPKIFLANLGPAAAFSARAAFAKSLFETGGVEASGNEGFSGPAEAAAAFRASGAKLACLCSSDDIYAGIGPAVVRALKGAGAGAVLVAGKPGAEETGLRAAGVDAFIFVGCDVLAALLLAYARLGVD